jgi:uncharacterized membrane protein
MWRTALLIYLYLTLTAAAAQTVTGRSNPVKLDVAKNKVTRASLAYTNVGLEDANRNHTLETYEQAVIRFVIKNMGKTPSRRIQVRAFLTEEVPGITLPETVTVETLLPGKSREIRLPIKTAAELPSSTAIVTIEVQEEGNFDTDQIEINVLTEATAANGNN